MRAAAWSTVARLSLAFGTTIVPLIEIGKGINEDQPSRWISAWAAAGARILAPLMK